MVGRRDEGEPSKPQGVTGRGCWAEGGYFSDGVGIRNKSTGNGVSSAPLLTELVSSSSLLEG